MTTVTIRERHGSHLEGQERAVYIQRIAVLSQYCERLTKQLQKAGIVPVAEPKLDEVRPAILAEGVVAELKRLQAELRIADQDLDAAEKRAEQLATELERMRVSAAGVGKASGPRPKTAREAVRQVFDEVRKEAGLPPSSEPIAGDDDAYMPADEDPALLNQQRIPEVATAATTAIEAKPAERPDPLDEAVRAYLVKRGHSASAWFIAKELTAAGRGASQAAVEAALERLLSAGAVKRGNLSGSIVWRV